MKTPKFILVALVLCICTMANAQTMNKVEADAKAKTEQLTQLLDLTENQEAMVYRKVVTLERQTLSYNAADKKTPELKEAYAKQLERFERETLNELTDAQRADFKKVWNKVNK